MRIHNIQLKNIHRNYTNETLQQYFVDHVFKLEQQEYRKEGIEWTNIEYDDHQDCLDLIQKVSNLDLILPNIFVKKGGVFSLIDEECRFPNGTDATLLEKLHQTFQNHPKYHAPKQSRNHFAVNHYAGTVNFKLNVTESLNRCPIQ